MKILILGGYGTFGGRLAQLLSDEERLTLLIAGRSQDKAARFCRSLSSKATLTPCLFDRDGDVAAQIKNFAPDLLVDASGPFQDYGGEPYRVVEACLAQGINYLDLADGSDFVSGIAQFDERARNKNLFILSGVSSFPVLTAAVVRRLAQGMKQLHSIKAGIAPSPYAGVGENVIRAIASYSGKPVRLVRRGNPATGYGFCENTRYTIAPPGKLPLRHIRFSLVDVPDLQVIPPLWPGLDSIWMGAGPVPEILHRMLNALAWLVRLKLIPSLLPLAPLFYRVINVLRWGEHRGGMFVEAQGSGEDGNPLTRSWHLLAEGNDGPMIPSMAIEALVRHMLAGRMPANGARAATSDIDLADYEELFRRRTITTGFRGMKNLPADAPLYVRVLDEAWGQLPPALQQMHNVPSYLVSRGTASIDRGTGYFASRIAKLIGFPEAGNDVPVEVSFTVKKGREKWVRNFGGKEFGSLQYAGKGRYVGLLCERFGPVTAGLALVWENEKLNLIVREWDVLGIPMPRFLAPCGTTYEYEKDGKFHFHVEIAHPIFGLMVRYRGSLTPV